MHGLNADSGGLRFGLAGQDTRSASSSAVSDVASLARFSQSNGSVSVQPVRPPPPICSDLVEVRAVPDYHGGGVSGSVLEMRGTGIAEEQSLSPPSSPDFNFLGRLVATLPGDQSHSPNHHGPSPPQAVVECNFWQCRGGLAGSTSSRAGPFSPSPQLSGADGLLWAGTHGVAGPGGYAAAMLGALESNCQRSFGLHADRRNSIDVRSRIKSPSIDGVSQLWRDGVPWRAVPTTVAKV